MASGVSTSVRPSAIAHSMSPASFSAAADISPILPDSDFADLGFASFLGCARASGSGARLPRGFVAALTAAALRTDIDLVPLLDHLVFAQLELAIGDAFACLDVVLIAVP